MNPKEALKSLCQNCYLNSDNCACHFHAKANVLNKTKDTEEFSCEAFKTLTALVERDERNNNLLALYRRLDDCIVAPDGHHVCRYSDDETYARIKKQIEEIEKGESKC